jgi:hypothetical protein
MLTNTLAFDDIVPSWRWLLGRPLAYSTNSIYGGGSGFSEARHQYGSPTPPVQPPPIKPKKPEKKGQGFSSQIARALAQAENLVRRLRRIKDALEGSK